MRDVDWGLLQEYEVKVGPLDVMTRQLGEEDILRLEGLMREAIDGKRPPLTNADLGIEIPDNAES